MRSILITGSNRGIGLELIKQLVSSKKHPEIIIGTCRKPEEAKELKALSEKYKAIHILKLDTTDFAAYGAFVKDVESIVGSQGLNVVINNAAISGDKTAKLLDLSAGDLTQIFQTNTVAPIMLTQALVPLLKKAAAYYSSEPMGIEKSAVINISSQLGSVSRNTFGGYYGYRESKAALNMVTRSISVELKDHQVLVVALHPGWVQTDMGGKGADLTVEYSVSRMLKTLFSLTEKHQGAFLQYDGETLPW